MGVALLLLAAAWPDPAQPVELLRTFAKGQRFTYAVKSDLTVEARSGTLDTFLPSDLGLEYRFTLDVLSLGADGIAKVRYLRPSITEIEGETFDSPPKRRVQKLDQDILITLSPVNEVLEYKDQPKAKKIGAIRPWSGETQDFIQDSLDDIYRMALFVGSPDSSLDLAPKLPLEEVKVGDTWKRTVSYQPQTLKGTEGKKAVQRLDYVYTYLGKATVNGRSVVRISGALDLDTDLGTYLNQLLKDEGIEDSPIKSMPLKVKGRIQFELDGKTLRTLKADATTEGNFQVFLTRMPDRPVEEERFKGTTTLREVPAKP